MADFVKGDVVVVPFPFSDLTHSKKRPALVVATPPGNDIILCQITSRDVRDGLAISISNIDFADGSLKVESNLRPNRIFTADKSIVQYRIGGLLPSKLVSITAAIVKLFSE